MLSSQTHYADWQEYVHPDRPSLSPQTLAEKKEIFLIGIYCSDSHLQWDSCKDGMFAFVHFVKRKLLFTGRSYGKDRKLCNGDLQTQPVTENPRACRDKTRVGGRDIYKMKKSLRAFYSQRNSEWEEWLIRLTVSVCPHTVLISLSRQGADCLELVLGVNGIFNSMVSVYRKKSARLEMPLPPTVSEALAHAEFWLKNKIWKCILNWRMFSELILTGKSADFFWTFFPLNNFIF